MAGGCRSHPQVPSQTALLGMWRDASPYPPRGRLEGVASEGSTLVSMWKGQEGFTLGQQRGCSCPVEGVTEGKDLSSFGCIAVIIWGG